MQITQPNHPKALRIFFLTEMWERYGFYVVQTLLALFLALKFKWNDKQVYELVGSFTALTYLSPLVGGWIADHLFGQKRAILAGALVLLASYLSLSLITGDQSLTFSLAGIAVGTGLLKPNISSLLGNEYPDGSPNRESGFTIFYMGLTSGIILGTTLPSYLNFYFGWSVAFASASIGMFIAMSIFAFGIHCYRIHDYHNYTFDYKKLIVAIFAIIALWTSAFYILNYPTMADTVFIGVVVFAFSYLLYCIKSESPIQARQTMIIALLCIISVMFWAFYFQMFLSLTLFIIRVVKPTLFGIQFPPPFYVGIQSAGMIGLGILFTRRKNQLNLAHQGVRAGNKFLLAVICMLIAYTIIMIACNFSPPSGLLSPLYLIPAYLAISLAEILLSPVGLSAVTVLASRKKVSTMMGIFFVSLGIGGFLSGKLATLTAIPLGEFSVLELKHTYAKGFTQLFLILLIMTLICFILNYVIKYLVRSTPNPSVSN